MIIRDVTETLELALQASGCDQADVAHKPRLLSDNESSFISNELAEWMTANDTPREMTMRNKTLH